MPLLRYFLYVGGVLVALLFFANSYLPNSPSVETSGPRLPVIHLYAERRGPEALVFDTRVPLPNPVAIAKADAGKPAQAAAAGASNNLREAFAQVPPSDAGTVTSADAKKPEQKAAPRKTARRHKAPTVRLVYQQSPFGWFGPQRFW
jgi:hypothetical protein